jgi:hypothetical protein
LNPHRLVAARVAEDFHRQPVEHPRGAALGDVARPHAIHIRMLDGRLLEEFPHAGKQHDLLAVHVGKRHYGIEDKFGAHLGRDL